MIDESIVEYLNNADYVVANVEAPITGGEIIAHKPLVHVNAPGCIEILKKINAKVWNLSNNHSMDCDVDGLKDTIWYATENDVLTVGAGYNKEQASKNASALV